jgi:hypothetical protein
MAIPSGVLTFQETAKLKNSPMLTRISDSLLRFDSVYGTLPWQQMKRSQIRDARRVGGLPTVSHVGLAEEPAFVKDSVEHFNENTYLIRDKIGVDPLELEDELLFENPMDSAMDAYMEAFAYDQNDKFINNTPLINPKAPPGIKWRITNPTLSGVNTDVDLSSGADVRHTATDVPAESKKFMESLRRLFVRMSAPTGQNIHLWMNEDMHTRIPFIIASANETISFSTAKDNYERQVHSYMGAKFHIIGRKADQTTQIILNTQDNLGADGGTDYTSIYATRLGKDYFSGWYFAPPKFKKLGVMESGVITQSMFEFYYGHKMKHTRSLGRLYGIRYGS